MLPALTSINIKRTLTTFMWFKFSNLSIIKQSREYFWKVSMKFVKKLLSTFSLNKLIKCLFLNLALTHLFRSNS